MTRRQLGIVAVVALVVTVFTGAVSVRRIGRQVAIARACSAVVDGRIAEGLDLTRGLAGADEDGRIVAGCRCRALRAVGRDGECAELLDGILRDPESRGWLLAADLVGLVVRHRQQRGDGQGAAELARASAAENPEDATLNQLEVATRSPLEGEQIVLEDLERRLAADPGSALGLRLALAVSYSRRQDHARVVAALGETPPPRGHPYLGFWFQARAWALAGLGDLPRLRASYAAWRENGGDPAAVEADYALQLSIAQLRDPEHSWVSLLERALEHEARLEDPRVPAALYLRWIGHLMVADQFDEALRLYDRAAERYELVGITREQLVQRQVVSDLSQAGAVETRGEIVFRLAEGLPRGTLLLSPDVDAEPDEAYEAHALAPGEEVTALRGAEVTPQRWVFRDGRDRVLASGSVWPVPGSSLPLLIRGSSGPATERASYARSPRPGDGRRRVFVLLPDCGDWRLVQYLRARGELPVMDALFEQGFRAVLESDPPLTAAAMEKLVWPDRGRDVSLLGELNRLGLELAGLASVGRNPLGFLAAALPEGRSLFEAVGSGPHVAANLLFSHGAIDAGRNATLIGPHGARRSGPTLRAWRELTAEERTEWPGVESERARENARTIAAEMDIALEIAQAGEVDLLLLRIEPLDLLSHELYGELAGTRQDGGRSGLLDGYRYIDRRVGELWNALDDDDVLVVLSDHGIRTAMEHSSDALFVAVGGGLPPGRAPGRPEIAGVPHALASLFGLAESWPDTGVAASWETATAARQVSRAP